MSKFILATCILLVLEAACAPSQPVAAVPQETSDSSPATDEGEAADATAAPTAQAAPDLIIAPETLSQLRVLWVESFPGDLESEPGLCATIQQACNLSTNIASHAFSPDGNTLAVGVCLGTRTEDRSRSEGDIWSCTEESAIVLYDSGTGDELGRLNPGALPLSLAYHPDGALLAAGLANSEIELWDLTDHEVTGTLSPNPDSRGIFPLAFTPDGNTLIFGTDRLFQLQLWDWRASESREIIERARNFAVSPDGSSLATLSFGDQSGDEPRVRLYDLDDLEQYTEFALVDFLAPNVFSFNPRNGWISGSQEPFSTAVNFWDPASGELAASIGFDEEFVETGISFNLNSGGFTSDGYFLLARYGELTAPEAQPEATGLSEPLWECGFALANVDANQILYFANPLSFEECAGPGFIYDMLVYQTKLSPDGRFLAAYDSYFGNLVVYGVDPSLPALPPQCSGDC